MKSASYKISSEVWLYPGMAGWHFVSLPKKQSDVINKKHAGLKKGWGSIPVEVLVGKTAWKTSIFPDKKSGVYILPIKADVRKKEGIYAKDILSFKILIGK